MKRLRLDQAMLQRGMAASRSQAENYIKLGYVLVNNKAVTKPGQPVDGRSLIKLQLDQKYVSRAALKLAAADDKFKLDWRRKTVLDVGSSTGGFTDYALRRGAAKIVAVDVGSHQLHPQLREDKRVELYEKTDIRSFKPSDQPDIILIDLSFISQRLILPQIHKISQPKSVVVALLKPQFEAKKEQINRGVIKNDKIRRQIFKNFENWVLKLFIIVDKLDSPIAGAKGNREHFYLLKKRLS